MSFELWALGTDHHSNVTAVCVYCWELVSESWDLGRNHSEPLVVSWIQSSKRCPKNTVFP